MAQLLFLIFLWMCPLSYAQTPEESVIKAQSSLEYTLGTLQESVSRLSQENRDMAASNEQLRLKLQPLNEQLKAEQAKELKIASQFQAISQRYQKKAAETAQRESRLREVTAARDRYIAERAAAENALKLKDLQDAEMAVRIESLSRELADMRSGLVTGEDHARELETLRADQDVLQKQLDVSTMELSRVRDEWKELTVAVNAGPQQIDVLSREAVSLKSDIALRTKEVDELGQKLSVLSRQLEETTQQNSPATLVGAEQHLQLLQAQAAALEKEVAELEKSARTRRSPLSPEAMLRKKEARFKDLYQRNRELKAGLMNLQRTMVTLDKKKADLEKMLDAPR